MKQKTWCCHTGVAKYFGRGLTETSGTLTSLFEKWGLTKKKSQNPQDTSTFCSERLCLVPSTGCAFKFHN